MKLTNYAERFIELKNIELDEKYALVSHAIQLNGTKEAEKYISMLEKKNVELNLKNIKKFYEKMVLILMNIQIKRHLIKCMRYLLI